MLFIFLPHYKFNFNQLINNLNLDFDFLGISECVILKSQPSNINVSLQNYLIEKTSTESTAEGVLCYILTKTFI